MLLSTPIQPSTAECGSPVPGSPPARAPHRRRSLRQRTAPVLTRGLLVLFTLTVAVEPLFPGPTRVLEINTIQEPTEEFAQFSRTTAEFDGSLFFGAFRPDVGSELFRTDGSVAGTVLVSEGRPGPASGGAELITAAGTVLYFRGFDIVRGGLQLWRSDGTEAGTVQLTDFSFVDGDFGVSEIVWDGFNLFFVADTANTGQELFVWNGAATPLEVVPGAQGSDAAYLAAAPGGGVYFSASTNSTGEELFYSDGTSVGTDLAFDINPGTASSGPRELVFVGGRLVMSALAPVQGRELVEYDPATETIAVIDIEIGTSSSPNGFAVNGNSVAFSAATTSHGREPWIFTAGQSAAFMLDDIHTGSASSLEASDDLVAHDSGFCFAATSASSGREPWCWLQDGSGARMLADLQPGGTSSNPEGFSSLGGDIFFSASSPSAPNSLFGSDGTAFSATLVTDFSTPSGAGPHVVGTINGLLIARVEQIDGHPANVLASVKANGFWEVLNQNHTLSSSWPSGITADGEGGLRFSAFRPDEGAEPWILDDQGVGILADVAPGADGLHADTFRVHRNRTVMLVNGGSSALPDEPYVWDGSTVQQVNLLGAGDSEPSAVLGTVGDRVLLVAKNSSSQSVVWSLDPVTFANEQLTTETPTQIFTPGFHFIEAGERSFFVLGDDLWVTDGTGAGTSLVAADLGLFLSGVALVDAGPSQDPVVVFLTGSSQPTLWVTDGTPAGTSDITPAGSFGALFVDGRLEARGGETLVPMKETGAARGDLYLTDGTAAGTTRVTDRRNNPDIATDNYFSEVYATSNGWFYRDHTTTNGIELWFFDGVASTLLEIEPGPGHGLLYEGSLPGIAVVEDLAVFTAFRSDTGFELWSSDGTLAGTQLAGEILPGPAGQQLAPVASGGKVYFAAFGPGQDGQELWTWSPPLFVDGFETGDTSAWN